MLANELADMHRVVSGTTMQWKSRCHLFILNFTLECCYWAICWVMGHFHISVLRWTSHTSFFDRISLW